MKLDDCVTCGKPKDAHYGVLKSCNIYPTYRSARDVIAQAGEAGTAGTTKIGPVHEHAVGNADAPKGEQS